jgi:DNA recombination protein RmuC
MDSNIIGVLLLFIGIVIGWFIHKYKSASTKTYLKSDVDALLLQIESLNNERTRLKEQNRLSDINTSQLKSDLDNGNNKILRLTGDLSKINAEYAALQEKLTEQRKEIENLQAKFSDAFENLANKILENKSEKFTSLNRENLTQILEPLKQKLKEFETTVRDTYNNETEQRISLKTEIHNLYGLNQKITKEVSDFTTALKGQSKIQGDWGEFIVEQILEKSGLVKEVHYLAQESIETNEGSRKKPDFIINLPQEKHIVVDSKVSLTAYQRYCETEDSDQQKKELQEHLNSVRTHIKELSSKDYQNLYKIDSPDFVLMFIPIEQAYFIAVQDDLSLFDNAFEKNIMLVTTSTLLAALRTVGSIWRQENQNKNAIEIARQSGALYDKFVGFVDDLKEIGEKIRATQQRYDDAMGKLSSGSGNLIRRAESIKRLGAKASKSLPQNLIDQNEDTSIGEN